MEGILLLMVVGWIVVSMLTASHAVNNGKTSLWGVVVLILGIFGLVGYAISLASD
jgi:hypothetical protein